MKTTALIIVTAVILSVGAIGLYYDKKNMDVKRLVLISVMTAMSVAGRIAFAPLPGFKPITAIVVITGIYLGGEAGFICGALTALISNFYFGQGPWTPFQMLVWGLIGIGAAYFHNILKKSRILLIIYGIIAGVVYSLLMDVYTVIWAVNEFDVGYYLVCVVSALPMTVTYALSNVIFLLALSGSFAGKIEHAIKRDKEYEED